jgi:hypothetical protein
MCASSKHGSIRTTHPLTGLGETLFRLWMATKAT